MHCNVDASRWEYSLQLHFVGPQCLVQMGVLLLAQQLAGQDRDIDADGLVI